MLSFGVAGDITAHTPNVGGDAVLYPTVALVDWGIPAIDESPLDTALAALTNIPQYAAADAAQKDAFLELAETWGWVATTWTVDDSEIAEMHRGGTWTSNDVMRLVMNWIDRQGGRQHQLKIPNGIPALLCDPLKARPRQHYRDTSGAQRVGTSEKDIATTAVLMVANYVAGLRSDVLGNDSEAELRWHQHVKHHDAGGVVWPEGVAR